MRLFETGRWPSIADRDDLKQVISEILDAGPEFDARFYQTEAFVGGFACQGDIVRLTSAAPCIDPDGNAIVTDATFDHWMIVGNTCDMHRDDEPRSLIAPLVGLAEPVPDEQLHTLRRYEYSRQFYVPPWPGAEPQRHHLVDFMQLVTIEIAAFREDCACVVARLQFPAWALLHACLVRYLARDDGRFD
jgi:hypothetical protein